MAHPSPVQSCTLSAGDATLVAGIRSAEQTAFEALHAAHHDALWRFAYMQVGCSHIAEELVQDVFLALWRKRAEWEVTTTVGGWLDGAVRHHVLRHLRQERAVLTPGCDAVAYPPARTFTVGTPFSV